MKILLVDDDAFIRDMYATKFGEEGHDVQVAKTGEQALEALRGENYDVVLMDMIMPGLDGIGLLKAIKMEKVGGNPVCIVLSNQGESIEIEAAKEAGAKGYLIKAELIPSEVVEKVIEIMA